MDFFPPCLAAVNLWRAVGRVVLRSDQVKSISAPHDKAAPKGIPLDSGTMQSIYSIKQVS